MTDGHEEEEEVGGICAANDKVARLYQQQRGQRRKRGGLTSPVIHCCVYHLKYLEWKTCTKEVVGVEIFTSP